MPRRAISASERCHANKSTWNSGVAGASHSRARARACSPSAPSAGIVLSECHPYVPFPCQLKIIVGGAAPDSGGHGGTEDGNVLATAKSLGGLGSGPGDGVGVGSGVAHRYRLSTPTQHSDFQHADTVGVDGRSAGGRQAKCMSISRTWRKAQRRPR